MSKQDLINFMAEDAGMSKVEAGRAIDSFWRGIEKGLKESGEVSFVGFGKFSVKTREAREGRNPATGETMKIPAKNVVSFKVGAKLKESVK